jgi:hypothetical protein
MEEMLEVPILVVALVVQVEVGVALLFQVEQELLVKVILEEMNLVIEVLVEVVLQLLDKTDNLVLVELVELVQQVQ